MQRKYNLSRDIREALDSEQHVMLHTHIRNTPHTEPHGVRVFSVRGKRNGETRVKILTPKYWTWFLLSPDDLVVLYACTRDERCVRSKEVSNA